VKLIVAEEGSDLADELWDATELKISSQLIYPEARAALAAAARADRIDPRGLRRAVADLDSATASMLLVGVDEAFARDAGRLAEAHALRGYDAVHLATALSAEDRELLVVTWDRDLADAVLGCGRPVAPALTGE
jgi:predicted nucleic acid-binding protein